MGRENSKAKTGLTSVTFRKKTCEEVIAIAKANNLDGIEWGGDIHVPCGDLETAKRVGELTRAAGLQVFSYGSYYWAGKQGFDTVCRTAEALGCKVVRIWSAHKSSVDCTEEDYEQTAQKLRMVSDIAKEYDITVCMEFHNNTINDTGASSVKLLEMVGRENIRTYWQPLYEYDDNVRDIAALGEYVVNLHVYNWSYGKEGKPTIRKMLTDDASSWQTYIDMMKRHNCTHNYIIEFCKEDSDENFAADAEFLNNCIDFN